MAKPRYSNFTLVTETESEVIETYREAFSKYQSFDGSATLYGTDDMGEISVILCK